VREDVEVLGTNSSAVDEVEEAQEDESVENDSQVLKLVNSHKSRYSGHYKAIRGSVGIFVVLSHSRNGVVQVEHGLTKENNETHNKDVPDRKSIDLSPDNLLHNDFFIVDRFLSDDGWFRRRSSQGEGTKHIHDQVNV